MTDVLSPLQLPSMYSNPPYPPHSKLFEPVAAPPYERPPAASGILRPSYTKSGDGSDLTMTQPTLQRYRRHREYYIDGGDIVFLASFSICFYDRPSSSHSPCCRASIQVENVLFRVHRSVPTSRNHNVSQVSLKVWRATAISSCANLQYLRSSSKGIARESDREVRMRIRVP
jgi:hypothetical protein